MSRVDTRALARFLAVTCGFSWSLHLALYLAPGLPGLAKLGLTVGSMFGPALGTLAVTRWPRRAPDVARSTGLVLGAQWPRFWALAWFGTPLLFAAALALSALVGTYDADLVGLSGFVAVLEKAGKALPAWATPHRLLGIQVAVVLILAPALNALPSFGEEWGWRGWLLPQLLPLGTWRALLLHGAIWGLWHAPLILQGHNYPDARVAGVLYMTLMCVLMGVLLGWTRLATGSIWPSVIAHASINALPGFMFALQREGTELDTTQVGLTGWPGWLLLAALVALLVWTRRLPGRAPSPASAPGGPAAPSPGVGG